MKLSRFILYLFLFVIILVLVNVIIMFYMTHNRIGRFIDQEKFNFQYKVGDSFNLFTLMSILGVMIL